MKRLFYPPPINSMLMVIFLLLAGNTFLFGEGSKDFRDYPGHRLFYNVEQNQQLKVYAVEGETINLGSSHVGINSGFIQLYRPDGTLAMTYDGADGSAIINNDVEELAGPTGGGTTSGTGYNPGIFQVPAGQTGVWSIKLLYPEPFRQRFFSNLLNSDPWTRTADQPTGSLFDQRVALAWDITVTQGGAGNAGGTPIEGRLYSNEYISILDGNNRVDNFRSTSPTFYILTEGGYLYQVDFDETDPWGFPIHSNNLGITNSDQSPSYMSSSDSTGAYTRSADLDAWIEGNIYLYEPQAEDQGALSNNKIFFNLPDSNMPNTATVTDVDPSRSNTHTTWLYTDVPTFSGIARPFTFKGILPANSPCGAELVAEQGAGGYFTFDTELAGQASLQIDVNGDGDYNDAVDLDLTNTVELGQDSIFWDGRDGEGNVIPSGTLSFSYNLVIRGGEIHVLMLDVENNVNGVTFTRMNGAGSPDNRFYYDHSNLTGTTNSSKTSGGGTAGMALPTTSAFTYSDGFGDNQLLDQWAFIETNNFGTGSLEITVESNCSAGDHDNDGIADVVDIDDDNDGVPDLLEFCHPDEGWACLPGGLDPSGDEDNDGIQNYQDSNDSAVNSGCTDADGDGVCDQIIGAYDTDGDNVPDHFDLDSDNDGLTDLVEAGHNGPDGDMNGVIDGDNSVFGNNGLYNPLGTNDTPTGVANYQPWDWDGDGIPDHDDLDSDNDGILDVVEAGYIDSDSDRDGRIDDGNGNVPAVNSDGIAPLIDPAITGVGIPNPIDWDNDNVPDWHDLDSDNDGILDVTEAGYASSDTNMDGRIDDGNGNIPTVNSDGLPPVMDPALTGQGVISPVDTDTDGVRDWHDLDSDNDGINDTVENNNPDGDGDGYIGTGPIQVDANGIAIADANDSLVPNPGVVNTDNTGAGDWRDLDADGDGINDVIEGGSSDPDGDGIIGTGTPTVNPNGQATEGTTSTPPDSDGNGIPDFQQVDQACEAPETPVLASNAAQACEGESVSFTATGVTGADLSYQWIRTNSDGTSQIVETTTDPSYTLNPVAIGNSGTYTVIALRDTCQSIASNGIALTVSPRPAAATLAANATGVCAGENITLTATDSDGADSYVWTRTNADGTSEVVGNTTDGTLTTPAASGTYTVLASGGGGTCPAATSNGIAITVIPNPSLPTLASNATEVCAGENITLTATGSDGADSYEWTRMNADGTSEVVGNTNDPTLTTSAITGTYTVSASGGGGACPAATSNGVAITVAPRPAAATLASNATEVCAGENITLTATGSDGADSYEWTRTNADGTSEVVGNTADATLTLPAVAGTYTVVASGGGGTCPAAASNGVVITVIPNPSLPTLASNASEVCDGENITLTATGSDGADSYEWTRTNADGTTEVVGNTNDPTLTIPAVAGTYTVSASGGGGVCPAGTSNGVAITVIPNPSLPTLASNATEVCDGENITFTATGSDGADSYEWTRTNADGTTEVVGNTNDPTLTIPAVTGTYTVSASGGGGACPAGTSNGVAITVTPKPVTPVIDTDEVIFCEGQTFTFNSTPVDGAIYEWYFTNPAGRVDTLAQTNIPDLVIQNLVASNTGDYSVRAIVNGCYSDESNKLMVDVASGGLPNVSATSSAPADNPACEGETVTLSTDEIDGATYEWTGPNGYTSAENPATIENATAAANGEYIVTITVNSCPKTLDPVTVQVDPKPATPSIASDKEVICPGEGFTLTTDVATGDNITYDWLLDGTLVITTDDPTLIIVEATPEDAGAYTVVVKDGGCPSDPSDPAVAVTVGLELDGDIIQEPAEGACEGQTVTLTAPAADGATYEWTGPNGFTSTEASVTLENVTADNNGDYSVVVTVDGCPITKGPVTLEINPKPATPSVASDKETVCPGDGVTLTTDLVTGDAIMYDWYLNGTLVTSTEGPEFILLDFQEVDAGDYTVSVRDGSCPSDQSAPVAVAIQAALDGVSASSNSPVCVGDPINLMVTDVEGATFEWTGPNGFTSTEQNPTIDNATEAEAGDYIVTVTINGCPATLPPATVEVTPKPAAPAIALDVAEVCEGTPASITITDPNPIPDGTTFTATTAEGATLGSSSTGTIEFGTDGLVGTHTITVISSVDGGCPSEPSNAVELVITPKPDEMAEILMPDGGDCGAAPAVLEAIAPTQGTGMWSSSNPAVIFSEPTNPTTGVTGFPDNAVTDVTWTLSNPACGEYSSATISINTAKPEITATNINATLQNDETSTETIPGSGVITILNGPSNGTATISGNTVTYTPDNTFVGSDVVTYEICDAICPDVCATGTISYTVEQSIIPCVVPDVITPNSDGLNDALVIPCADGKNVGIKIFNRWGDLVFEDTNYNSNWTGTHDGEPLPPGPYYYIFDEQGVEPKTGCVSIAR